jgi:large subunit ribosomal protein L31
MKAEGHPDYHTIKVVLTTGESYETRSTWGSEGEEMRLDIDPNNHPAWQGGTQKVIEKGQLSKFEKKFAGFGLSVDSDSK